nr:hypothetical protein [uncultured Pseudomonas sp.]
MRYLKMTAHDDYDNDVIDTVYWACAFAPKNAWFLIRDGENIEGGSFGKVLQYNVAF